MGLIIKYQISLKIASKHVMTATYVYHSYVAPVGGFSVTRTVRISDYKGYAHQLDVGKLPK